VSAGEPGKSTSPEAGMSEEARAALLAIRNEYPEWNITLIPGKRPYWLAWRSFDSPAEMVTVQCFSARVLRGRLMANSWLVKPRDSLIPGFPGSAG
jgi:hypothetical protein